MTESLADHMRLYRHFDIAGIDLLMDLLQLNIPKQCQSISHQEGKDAMISELYGVTGYDFDFRHHKLQGDWQAAMGVSIRTPHLSWYSMRGSAKRDYPASFNYQSPWYKDYSYLEDHYSRVHTALTRGTPHVKIAVVHPVESAWLEYGAEDQTGHIRTQLIKDFETTYSWLLYSCLDFDYLNESSLPEQYRPTEEMSLQIGQMAYETVILSGMETIRSSTVKILTQFRKKGGKVIFLGKPPKFVDASIPAENDPLFDLIANSEAVPFTKTDLVDALKEERELEIRLAASGLPGEDWIYNMRQDGNSRWLFLATAVRPVMRGKKGSFPDMDGKEIVMTLKGKWVPTFYDTLTGEIAPIPYEITPFGTVIRAHMYPYDSLLLRLDSTDSNVGSTEGRSLLKKNETPTRTVDFRRDVAIKRTEDNVVLLDMARWSEDGVTYFPEDELRTIDTKLRKQHGYPDASGRDVQPWLLREPAEGSVYLKFTVASEIDAETRIAYEAAEEILVDGKPIDMTVNGYYTDRSIVTSPMPTLTKGEHEIQVKVPFGKRDSLENLFLLGDFDVKLCGTLSTITAPNRRLPFVDLSKNGMPFYGAAVEYELPFELEKESRVVLSAQNYKGSLMNVAVDGKKAGRIVFSPYRLDLGSLPAGKHTITLTAVLTRNNSFNNLHNVSGDIYIGKTFWFADGYLYAYEYQTIPTGVLQSPRIEIYE